MAWQGLANEPANLKMRGQHPLTFLLKGRKLPCIPGGRVLAAKLGLRRGQSIVSMCLSVLEWGHHLVSWVHLLEPAACLGGMHCCLPSDWLVAFLENRHAMSGLESKVS